VCKSAPYGDRPGPFGPGEALAPAEKQIISLRSSARAGAARGLAPTEKEVLPTQLRPGRGKTGNLERSKLERAHEKAKGQGPKGRMPGGPGEGGKKTSKRRKPTQGRMPERKRVGDRRATPVVNLVVGWRLGDRPREPNARPRPPAQPA